MAVAGTAADSATADVAATDTIADDDDDEDPGSPRFHSSGTTHASNPCRISSILLSRAGRLLSSCTFQSSSSVEKKKTTSVSNLNLALTLRYVNFSISFFTFILAQRSHGCLSDSGSHPYCTYTKSQEFFFLVSFYPLRNEPMKSADSTTHTWVGDEAV